MINSERVLTVNIVNFRNLKNYNWIKMLNLILSTNFPIIWEDNKFKIEKIDDDTIQYLEYCKLYKRRTLQGIHYMGLGIRCIYNTHEGPKYFIIYNKDETGVSYNTQHTSIYELLRKMKECYLSSDYEDKAKRYDASMIPVTELMKCVSYIQTDLEQIIHKV